jgi:hypothetical protein
MASGTHTSGQCTSRMWRSRRRGVNTWNDPQRIPLVSYGRAAMVLRAAAAAGHSQELRATFRTKIQPRPAMIAVPQSAFR